MFMDHVYSLPSDVETHLYFVLFYFFTLDLIFKIIHSLETVLSVYIVHIYCKMDADGESWAMAGVTDDIGLFFSCPTTFHHWDFVMAKVPWSSICCLWMSFRALQSQLMIMGSVPRFWFQIDIFSWKGEIWLNNVAQETLFQGLWKNCGEGEKKEICRWRNACW